MLEHLTVDSMVALSSTFFEADPAERWVWVIEHLMVHPVLDQQSCRLAVQVGHEDGPLLPTLAPVISAGGDQQVVQSFATQFLEALRAQFVLD